MTGHTRITRKAFYAQGGFSNPRLCRVERSHRWTYWKRND